MSGGGLGWRVTAVTVAVVFLAVVPAHAWPHGLDGATPQTRRPHHIPKGSIFATTKAFDFEAPVLSAPKAFSLAFRLRVLAWEPSVSIVGQPGLLEVYTGEAVANNATGAVQGGWLRVWVKGTGSVVKLPVPLQQEVAVHLIVVKGGSVTLSVNNATETASLRTPAQHPPAPTAAPTAPPSDSSLRIGGGKGADGDQDFMADVWQVKVWEGVVSGRDEGADAHHRLLASAWPTLNNPMLI